MGQYDKYGERILVNGDTYRKRQIELSKTNFVNIGVTSPSLKDLKIGKLDGELDGIDRQLLVTSTAQMYAKIINTMPDENFDVGNIVFWNNSRWLITQKDIEDAITTRGGMELCNTKLRWQNPETKEIHERWVTVDKPYFANLDNLKPIEVSTRQFKIQTSYDEETRLLDDGKRFMMEIIGDSPKTYRITSVDTMSERYAIKNDAGELSGFLIFNIEQDSYNEETDNKELMICNYQEPDPITPIPTSNYAEFKYIGEPTIRQGFGNKLFEVIVKDEFGVEITAVTNITVNIPPEFINNITVTYDINSVRLSADSKTPIGTMMDIIVEYLSEEIGRLRVEVVGIY